MFVYLNIFCTKLYLLFWFEVAFDVQHLIVTTYLINILILNDRFWQYGSVASDGLQQVAEHGATRLLESELKGQVPYV